MERRRNIRRQENTPQYTPEQVRSVLTQIGVDIEGETHNDFLCFCPIHGNRDTPSFSVGQSSGAFICFNPSCAATGTLVQLITKLRKLTLFEAMRLIYKAGTGTAPSFAEQLKKVIDPNPEFKLVPQEAITQAHDNFKKCPDAVGYMIAKRGFTRETLTQFQMGYDPVTKMLSVPAHNVRGEPIGWIGRGLYEKRFKNTSGMHTSKFLFNMHRARRHGDTVIICESSFDAMRIHQAGYPNVVASLGGHFSAIHFDLIERSFSRVIIMTDFDNSEDHRQKNYCGKCNKAGRRDCVGHNPGRDLGQLIASGLINKEVLWASYGYGTVYPHGAKDAGDMTDDEIVQCLQGAVNGVEYQSWNLYYTSKV